MPHLLEVRTPPVLPLDAFLACARGKPVRVTVYRERDFQGQLLNFSLYAFIGVMFMVAVVDWGWQERFLLATLFFFATGAMALADALGATCLTYYAVEVSIDGSPVRHVVRSLDEAQAIAAAAGGDTA